ncbi:MAG: PilT3: twitchung motility proteIN [Verrucomicrobiota bacterium]|jgi:twitching motility protein PilT
MDTSTPDSLDTVLNTMIRAHEGVSDLLFIAGKPPQAEAHGKLKSVAIDGGETPLTSARIELLARTIIAGNARLAKDLTDTGSCDCSYTLPDVCRFRVNIYKQNGNFAMVLRRLQTQIPSMEKLNLAPVFREIIKEKTGIIFVTGGTGSGKTTTLAALLNEINLTSEVHVVTLEDPIEFLHPHLKATFSQRELGRDYFTFPDGLRAALRQAPKIIFVGEIRDRDTMEIALTAAETGHVVYSTLHTISAGQTINRVLGMFTQEEEKQVRERLAETLRYVVSQRLAPKVGGGRLLITELMGASMRTREAIQLGENDSRRLIDIIEAGSTAGWHSFEQSLAKAYEENLITEDTALLYCGNRNLMRQRLDLINKRRAAMPDTVTLKMKGGERSATPPPVSPPPGAASPGAPPPAIWVDPAKKS